MERILIIDDDEVMREVLRDVLEEEGYEIVEAQNGQEGIQRYRSAPVGLVITDLCMPEKNGLETIQELRRDFCSIAFPRPLVISVAKETGFDLKAERVRKPCVATAAVHDLALNRLWRRVSGHGHADGIGATPFGRYRSHHRFFIADSDQCAPNLDMGHTSVAQCRLARKSLCRSSRFPYH